MAIGGLKNRLRSKFSRRHSTASNASGELSAPNTSHKTAQSVKSRASQPRLSSRSDSVTTINESERNVDGGVVAEEHQSPQQRTAVGQRDQVRSPSAEAATTSARLRPELDDRDKHNSTSSVEFLTPNTDIPSVLEEEPEANAVVLSKGENIKFHLTSFDNPAPASASTTTPPRIHPAPELSRRQSLLPHQQTRLIKTLLETELPVEAEAAHPDYFANNGPSTISPNMVSRKIWVKRPGASATLVTIHEDDLVDDVRDMILKKYANSLGRTFDAPDVTLRVIPREQRQERTLGPEEPMSRTLDAYFPGGQTVDEALVIDVPVKRTPKPSPHATHRYYDEQRPAEAGSDYFPPMPAPAAPSPHVLPVNAQPNSHHGPLTTHSMSVLTTGHVPPLPSPGSTRRYHRDRPRIGRQPTSSPTVASIHGQAPVLNNGTQVIHRGPRSRTHSSASENSSIPPPVAPPLPTSPTQNNDIVPIPRTATPPPRVSSPRPPTTRPYKKKKVAAEHPSLPAGMLNGAIPPINVLIVEDNIINLKLLEAFMKRLKVRWQSAMNGREAVTKWRTGGFHLVLMDIQLPIMSGLEATKEIRRLERLNSIGVFSSSASSSAPEQRDGDEPEGDDKLPSDILFKSPVIIVALTASSLQSDRHEALAAGCNDFLTKPVNFVWLERKVMEWGCMQALIDFDGWRKWKDFSQNGTTEDGKSGEAKKGASASKKKKNRQSLSGQAGTGSTRVAIQEENEGANGTS